jgi:carbonic anhydrase
MKTKLITAFSLAWAAVCVVTQIATAQSPATSPAATDKLVVQPADAIARLKEGNGRFMSGNLGATAGITKRREELTQSQHPFAIIVGCADSRVPPEIVFDQGLGGLFVLRVAGNVVNDHSLGSIEYAVDHLEVRLIVVLGHQSCGAVKAAKEIIASKSKAPGHVQSLVTAIQPAVKATVNADLEATIEANVKNVVRELRSSMPVLKPKVDSDELKVVGAKYSLDTGAVSFLDAK